MASAEYDGGFKGLLPLLAGIDKAKRRPKLHLVGHSAGSIVLGHLAVGIEAISTKQHGAGQYSSYGAGLHG